MGPLPWGFQDEIQDSSSVTRLLGDPKSQISFGWLLYIPYIPLKSIKVHYVSDYPTNYKYRYIYI